MKGGRQIRYSVLVVVVGGLSDFVLESAFVVDGAVSLVLSVEVVSDRWAVLMFVVLTGVMGHVGFMFVVNGTLMGLSLELNMGLLLMVLLVVRVDDVRHFMVDGGVMDDARLVMVSLMMVALSLDVVRWVLVSVLMSKLMGKV